MLESRRLRHFLTVHDLGSIGQAAERLLLTQPALSKSIRQLEENLGVQLFERTSLGVLPTVFGKALALHAKAIEAQVRHAEAQIGALKGTAKGQVSVGIGPSIATRLMPLVTRRIRDQQLECELSVMEGLVDDIIPALRRGEIDLAVGTWPKILEPAFATEVLALDRLSIVARKGHPLTGRRVEFSEMLSFPWALPPSSQRWRQHFDEFFFTQGLSAPKPMVVSNSASYLKALLRDEDFLSFLPELLIDEDDLQSLEVDMPEFEAEISLTYKERSLLNPACLEVAELLRTVAAEMRPAGPAPLRETA